jgi:hypothetical protein
MSRKTTQGGNVIYGFFKAIGAVTARSRAKKPLGLPSNFLINPVSYGLERFRVVRLSSTVSLGKNGVYGPETPISALPNVLEAGGIENQFRPAGNLRF